MRTRWLYALTFSVLWLSSLAADEVSDYKPGSNKSIAWTRKDINACWGEYKPILLYIYDIIPRKSNPIAYRFEREVFTDVMLQKGLSDFNCVMIQDSTTSWPASLRDFARNGAVVYVMTCDAKPVQSWTHYNNSTANEIIAALEQAKALNGRVATDLKRNPPKPYVDTGTPNSLPPSSTNTAGGFSPPPAAPSVPRPDKENTVPGLTLSNEKKPPAQPKPPGKETAKGNLPPPPPAPKVPTPDSPLPVSEKVKKSLADEE